MKRLRKSNEKEQDTHFSQDRSIGDIARDESLEVWAECKEVWAECLFIWAE